MIRAVLTALATAALAATATAASDTRGAASRSRADSPAPTASPTPASAADDPASALAWTLPAGWLPVPSQLTALAQPVHRLAAATFALRQDKPDRGCRPDTARAQLPADGALVYLLEDRVAAGRPKRLAHYPARPAHFRIGRARSYECLGPGAIVWWREQDRAFQAQVLLGPLAGAARRRQTVALLDSLVVRRIAPPAPPIGLAHAARG